MRSLHYTEQVVTVVWVYIHCSLCLSHINLQFEKITELLMAKQVVQIVTTVF